MDTADEHLLFGVLDHEEALDGHCIAVGLERARRLELEVAGSIFFLGELQHGDVCMIWAIPLSELIEM